MEQTAPIDHEQIAKVTSKDSILIKVLENTMNGWPSHITDDNIKPYFIKRNELSVDKGCLCWGLKVVIPPQMRTEILHLFHEQHLGIVRSKMLLRSYCWWPSMCEELEKFISNCNVCQSLHNCNTNARVLPWPSAPNNFYRVHNDFYEIKNVTFLILVDSRSKWMESKIMNSTTAAETIKILKTIFSSGCPCF